MTEFSLVQKIRLRFRKRGEARFLSHHDLMRLFERVVRRAELPIRMTEGFNPHPRISFPLALGLGIEAENEVVEFELSSWLPAREVARRMSALLPAGVEVMSAKVVSPGAKGRVRDVTYEVEAPEGAAFWGERIERVLGSAEIVVVREKKGSRREVDIRPFLLDISYGNDRIRIQVKMTPEGTARVDEVLQALLPEAGGGVSRRVVRSHLTLVDNAELERRGMGS